MGVSPRECGCVVVGWMLVTEMMGWMCGVGCHSLHRAEALPRAKTLG